MKVARKLRIPVVPKKIFQIEKVEHIKQSTSQSYSPHRNNEGSKCDGYELPRQQKHVGSKRRLFETSNDNQQDSAQSKRHRLDDIEEEGIESSSLKCLETLVKLILASERNRTH